MDYFIELHSGLTLAEKLLKYKHIQGCFEICRYLEDLFLTLRKRKCLISISVVQEKKLAEIQRKLNMMIVCEFRESQRSKQSGKLKEYWPKNSLANTQI